MHRVHWAINWEGEQMTPSTRRTDPAASGQEPSTSPAAVVQQVLRDSPYQALRCLSCQWHDGVLTIRGCVPSFYLKQLAQNAARRVGGIERIENLVEVATQD
jgi:hypothetical protein